MSTTWTGEATARPPWRCTGPRPRSHWYDLVIPHLRDRVRIIAPDQRGHGKIRPAIHRLRLGDPGRRCHWNAGRAGHRPNCRHGALMGSQRRPVASAALHPDRVTSLVMIDGGFGVGPRSPNTTWEEFKERLSPRDIYGPRERYLGALRSQFDHCWSEQLEYIVMSMVRIASTNALSSRTSSRCFGQCSQTPPTICCQRCQCPVLMVAAEGLSRGEPGVPAASEAERGGGSGRDAQ